MPHTELTNDNLKDLIANSETLIIDFWADWCGPCKMFGPIFDKASEKHPEVVFAKCNTEKAQEIAAAFGVRSIPTVAIFRQNVLLFMQPGLLDEKSLDQLLTKVKELNMDEVRAEMAEAKESKEDTEAPSEDDRDGRDERPSASPS